MEQSQSLCQRETSDFESCRLLIAAAITRCQGLDHPLLRQRSYGSYSFLFVCVHKLKVFLTQQTGNDGHQFILFVEDVQMISLGRDGTKVCSLRTKDNRCDVRRVVCDTYAVQDGVLAAQRSVQIRRRVSLELRGQHLVHELLHFGQLRAQVSVQHERTTKA